MALNSFPVQNFYDDFFAAEPEKTADSGFHFFGVLNAVLGFDIKKEKDVPPSELIPLLGHNVNLKTMPFQVECTESRLAKLRNLCDRYIESETMSRREAQEFAGKANFAGSAFFGKLGRAPLVPFFQRCGWKSKRQQLNTQSILALKWFKQLLRDPAPRVVFQSGRTNQHHVCLYVDATGGGSLGACFVGGPSAEVRLFAHCLLSRQLKGLFEKRANSIQLFEMCAAIFGMVTFRERLEGKNVIVFCDNTAQAGAFQKGYSSRLDCAILAHIFWSLCLELHVAVWIEWVGSGSNVADLPSRLDARKVEELARMGFVRASSDFSDFSRCFIEYKSLFAASRASARSCR